MIRTMLLLGVQLLLTWGLGVGALVTWWRQHQLLRQARALTESEHTRPPLALPQPSLRPELSGRERAGWFKRGVLQWQTPRRIRRVEAQLPEALDFITRALRAGHDLGRALELAAAELPAPLAQELGQVAETIGYGAGLGLALRQLAIRVPSSDVRALVMAGCLHRETGGDILRVFARLAQLMREREQMRERARTLAAEGRLSAWILSLLPLGCAAGMQALHPGLLALLSEDVLGQRALCGALLLWMTGILWMWRLQEREGS